MGSLTAIGANAGLDSAAAHGCSGAARRASVLTTPACPNSSSGLAPSFGPRRGITGLQRLRSVTGSRQLNGLGVNAVIEPPWPIGV